jgi:predicted transcriptional regulator of viral defense system
MDPQSGISDFSAKVRVGAEAEKGWGRIHWSQLRDIGVPSSTISGWAADGYLYEVLPRVYAVGHPSGPIEADLAAALLYAGPGAMLSHQTAAWWWGLTDRRPREIHITTPRRCRSRPGIRVHGRRQLDRVWHNGLPVGTVPQTLLDYASQMPFDDVRYVLAEADYHRLMDVTEVTALAGRGKAGAAKLRKALAVHWPELARTDSPAEREFLFLIEAAGLPRPKVNVRLCGLMVDAYWPEYGVAVEIDGHQGHGTERQVARDHGRDLTLRAEGIIVRRYARRQIRWEGPRVLADLRAAGLP